MKSVASIVVTYNRIALLKEVVDALRKQSYTDHQIIVVNNGSTDNTSKWLEQQKDIITINQENLGGAGGFFTGIKYAVEKGYKYCWIMDDDVICQPDALGELMKAYTFIPNAGYVCSRVIGIDGQPMNTPFADMRPSSNGYSDIYDLVADHSLVKVKNSTFVSVLFGSSIVREVGLPIKEFFIWGDDSEYTGRISAKHPCYIACRSIVVHKRSLQKNLDFMEETDPKRIKNYYYYFRNNLYIIKKTQSDRAFKKSVNENRLFAIRRFLKKDKLRASVLWRAINDAKKFNPTIVFPERS